MKHSRKTTYIGLMFLFGLFISSIQAVAAADVRYNLKTGDFYYYECTHAFYTAGTVKVQKNDPLNTTVVKIDIIEATVGSNTEKTAAWGNYYADIWLMNVGDNWEQVQDNALFLLDSSDIETFGAVALTDGSVSNAKIIDFFSDTTFLIPNPAGLTDTHWNQIKQKLEGNILFSYGQSVVAAFTKEERKFVIPNFGPDADKYTLEMIYNENGTLALYSIYNKFQLSGQEHIHTIFKAELLKDSVVFPDNLDEFPWQALLIMGLVIVGVVVIIIIWRKKR
jgi:hypothetical protein